MDYPQRFGVIVIGGGHAGTEAALAAARLQVPTLLITQNIETLGQMSCNPAIGGIGKGHLVKEIDALGGIMAHAADHSGIQFRVLNRSKGAAVRSTRAQADRILYKAAIRNQLENQPFLHIFQQSVADLIVQGEQVQGVITQTGIRFHADTVVLTAGTFLAGLIHVGLDHYEGGRAGDPPANLLAARLRELPLHVSRLKTGTPCRIDGKSIDFSKLEQQAGDCPTPIFSFMGTTHDHPQQVPCWITHTNVQTHDIIRANLDRSPLYAGVIESTGPRYCPSIEDKIMRFADKDRHQIFLEPEGLTTHEYYPNGISTSLPFDVQVQLVRSIVGLENAHITRPGYAIEYDFFDPRDLHPSLETKSLHNLWFAGQINGTTGYEEAAAQGLLAGLNAARRAQGSDSWYPQRHQAYLGVLVDDLLTQGTTEPYRMFTSRAEHRLILREDNADQRLTPIGRDLGLVDDLRWHAFCKKQEQIMLTQQHMREWLIRPDTATGDCFVEQTKTPLTHPAPALTLLKRSEVSVALLKQLPDAPIWLQQVNEVSAEQVEIQEKYAGYIARSDEDIARRAKHENTLLPQPLDYQQVAGLSREICEKLNRYQPTTIGQATRIAGVTPAAISLLLVHLKRSQKQQHRDEQVE